MADVATRLQTAGVGTVGTDIFRGPERVPATGVPDVAVFVLASGGAPASPYLGTATDWHEVALQLLVRGAVNAYETARTKALAVRAALHRCTLSGYTLCMVRESEPLYLGRDHEGRHEFALNVRVGFDA